VGEGLPVTAEDGVEGFLIHEVDAVAVAAEIVDAAAGDIVGGPGGEVDEEEAGVEVRGVGGEAEFAPGGDAEAGGDEGDAFIGDGEGDGRRGERGIPEFGGVAEDEHIAIEPEDAGEMGG
jgi:hypothetical protein